MKYCDGREVLIGDTVRLGTDRGVVVFLIDTGECVDGFPAAEWAYLARGILVSFTMLGLVHIEESDRDILLLERAPPR